jgi:hypothetical protein
VTRLRPARSTNWHSIRFDSRHGQELCLFSKNSQTGSAPHPVDIEGKLAGVWTSSFTAPGADFQNEWISDTTSHTPSLSAPEFYFTGIEPFYNISLYYILV